MKRVVSQGKEWTRVTYGNTLRIFVTVLYSKASSYLYHFHNVSPYLPHFPNVACGESVEKVKLPKKNYRNSSNIATYVKSGITNERL